MKNLFKKMSAILIAAVMVLAMASTAFAKTGNMAGTKPTGNDTGSVTISGLVAGDRVDLYKIVEAQYNNDGFYGYKAVDGVAIANTTTFVPTTAEIATLANQSLTSVKNATVAKGATSVEIGDLKIGSYLVKVTAGQGNITVYNPMVVSVAYVAEGNTTKVLYGAVNADSNYEINGSVAYAKSSKETTPDKNIKNGSVIVNGVAAKKGDAVAKGDTVTYEITGTIPSYNPDYYTSPVYIITDTISEGLAFNTAKTVKESLQKQADDKFGANKATVEVIERTITITLKPEYIITLAAKTKEERSYKFEYSALLNGKSVNFDASTNTVKVNYSNTPTTTTDSEEVKTYHYTFAFNGDVTKVNEENKPLVGAKFGLFTDTECKTPAINAYTSEQITAISTSINGNAEINFTGLDNKVYYMKEIATPSAEYKLNNTVYKVEFTPTLDAEGKMSQYEVTVKDMSNNTERTNTYVPGDNNTATISGDKSVTEIQNTKLGNLPSTGGMGTYLFTIIGVVVMAGAAGAFFISRRKGSEE